MSAPEQKRDFVVEMFHRINRLRQKVGAREGDSRPGFIDPRAIARAEKIVENKEVEFSHDRARTTEIHTRFCPEHRTALHIARSLGHSEPAPYRP